MDTTSIDNKELCARSVHIMADGNPEDFEAIIHPDARNREAVDEPPATRGRGPAAFHATALSPMHVRTREWHAWARTSVDGVLRSFPSTENPLTS